ncbi:helix-turn-helix domain-containing protein [Paraburkholderia agricolaris]|jgi:hypothetical protein|uniref:Helix-turn-helix domain-containing protein n=1 Tax=Paraburkholderia agricolaris TaxID=2152888 RepID=A0ABW8ZQE4_9BURK
MASANNSPEFLGFVDQRRSAQRARALAMLQLAPRTTYDFRTVGVSHPAARIRELIEIGYRIEVDRIDCADGAGFFHRGVARYRLAEDASQSTLPLFR